MIVLGCKSNQLLYKWHECEGDLLCLVFLVCVCGIEHSRLHPTDMYVGVVLSLEDSGRPLASPSPTALSIGDSQEMHGVYAMHTVVHGDYITRWR